ncbi:MAG: HDIG domain-containing protein [Phycisphaerales bacterium]|nr:HDIG domain-containing protein [Phycisphaerales bacterium]
MAARRAVNRAQAVRQRNGRRSVSWSRLWKAMGSAPVLSAAALFAAATAIALYGGHSPKYAVGQKFDHPIYPDVDFETEDAQQTLRHRQAARASVPSHYGVDGGLIAEIATALQNVYQAAQAAETYEAFQAVATANGWRVDGPAYQHLHAITDEPKRKAFEERIGPLRERLASEYTRSADAERERTPASTANVAVVHGPEPQDGTGGGGAVRDVNTFALLPISNEVGIRRAAGDLAGAFAPPLRAAVADLLASRLSTRPLLAYDAALTNEKMAEAEQGVGTVLIKYERDQPMIPVRADTGLTPSDLELLAIHDQAYRSFIAGDAPGARALRDQELLEKAGVAVVLALATVGLFVYLGVHQRRVLEVPSRTLALAAVVAATLLAARLIDARLPFKSLTLVPVLFTASVLAIAYSRRFAAGVMIIVAIMVTPAVRGDIGLLVTLMVGVAATVYMLQDIRTRTQLLWVGLASGSAVFLSTTAFGLLDRQAWGFAAGNGAWSAGAALASAMMVQMTLPFIERIGRVATALTLLEWRDPTRPLLQRLAREAPGTYTHSLALGTLAEAACREIGANGLLAQVGALYHDIGKLNKAAYFAENQEAKINRHDRLSPTMSLLIIIGHVKDGLEFAREYKLPRVLHPFIEEHHGTTVVQYFHRMASDHQPQIASGRHDRDVPESQFRYPGPKPSTRESAVLMMCDGVEGAVRTLAEPSPGRIENVVHQIVTARLNDGQFDDCDITLRQLRRVEESLVRSLCSYYHGRISYPKAREKDERPANHVRETAAKVPAGATSAAG